jgi:two-component SAPR family response regulator
VDDDVARTRPALRVLVLEDQFLIALEIEGMLARLGCTVVGPVPSVARAFDLLERDQVDFAILDVNLGDERSTPVAEALRARGVPFALATGYDGRQLAENAFQDAQHLGKPIEFHLLAETIRRITDSRDTT